MLTKKHGEKITSKIMNYIFLMLHKQLQSVMKNKRLFFCRVFHEASARTALQQRERAGEQKEKQVNIYGPKE